MNGKNDFEKDLDEYISERRKSRFLHNVVQGLRSHQTKIQLNPELETYDRPFEPEPKPQPNGHNFVEAPRKKGMLGWLFSSEPDEDLQKLNLQLIPKDDLKEVARITLDIVKKLPPQELVAFKQSQSFVILKDTLKRHNLIK